MTTALVRPVTSLYVHVPFCVRKCAYCGIFSQPAHDAVIQRYITSLVREMELKAPVLKLQTVFFGGGTPSLLPVREWERVFQAMSRLDLAGAGEWTVECNPATVTLEKARLWQEMGVTRVSLGAQSLDESVLDRLGRLHSRAAVFKAFDVLRRAGFANINLDLMFAIPGQEMGAWQKTIGEALAMQSEHLACYEVIYEEDTPLFEQLQGGLVALDEDLSCAMYEELIYQTDRHGLVQYEIANFARPARNGFEPEATPSASLALPTGGGTEQPGPVLPDRRDQVEDRLAQEGIPRYACRHNINYWRGGSYCGLGPSAVGYIDGRRCRNVEETAQYCERLEAGDAPTDSVEELPPLARAGEIAAFGLRMNCGWGFAAFEETTGLDLRRHWRAEMDELVELGWGLLTPERFRLSAAGLRFADAAAERFLR